MKKTWKIVILVSLISVIGIGYFSFKSSQENQVSIYDNFAKCLTEQGADFYGAYWCPHCKEQKDLFGSSVKYLNYIECDARGDNAQVGLCLEKDIRGYPTWIINGSRYEGAQSLVKLSQLTGCSLS